MRPPHGIKMLEQLALILLALPTVGLAEPLACDAPSYDVTFVLDLAALRSGSVSLSLDETEGRRRLLTIGSRRTELYGRDDGHSRLLARGGGVRAREGRSRAAVTIQRRVDRLVVVSDGEEILRRYGEWPVGETVRLERPGPEGAIVDLAVQALGEVRFGDDFSPPQSVR